MNSNGHRPKMFAMSVCVKCGGSFTVTSDEQIIPHSMRMNKDATAKVVLKTWADWVDHASSHCGECRYSQPPRLCVADLKKHLDGDAELKAAINEAEMEDWRAG
jgi:hypothetical protein